MRTGGVKMGRMNPLNTVPGNSPLIHEVHGEPYKVVKAVYGALPWLWSKLGMLAGALVSTFYVKATLSTTEATQVIPYPMGINMMNIRNSVVWVLTNDFKRRYKYRNCYLDETGLHLNIDLDAPADKRGAKIIWNMMLANRPWGRGPHGGGFFQNAWEWQDDNVPPFHYARPPFGVGHPCPPPEGYAPFPGDFPCPPMPFNPGE